jgi:hypothetical protein
MPMLSSHGRRRTSGAVTSGPTNLDRGLSAGLQRLDADLHMLANPDGESRELGLAVGIGHRLPRPDGYHGHGLIETNRSAGCKRMAARLS